VIKATERGWIPHGDEPDVTAHLEAARSHLAASGVAEDDAFLLRYALVVPGVQRGIVPPLTVLEPNRSSFSERKKKQPAAQVIRLRGALDLGRAVLPGLSQETAEALGQLATVKRGPTMPSSAQTAASWPSVFSKREAS
jgi:hypothetical protein